MYLTARQQQGGENTVQVQSISQQGVSAETISLLAG